METAADEFLFKCPKIECPAEYFAIHRIYAPDKKPRCRKCDTPFVAMEKSRYVHYRVAWDIVPLHPDKSDDPSQPL